MLLAQIILNKLFLIAVRFNQDGISLNKKSGHQTSADPLSADVNNKR